MLTSMTGFGRASERHEAGQFVAEISSVNHRFLEVSVRLPRELLGFESSIQQKIREKARRGKVQVRLEVAWAPEYRILELREEVLESYLGRLDDFLRKIGRETTIDPSTLLSLPGVFEAPLKDEEAWRVELEGIIDTLMENAINAWVLMRQEEGNHLQEAIEQQLDNLEALTGEMGVAAEKAKEEAVENLRKRILEVMALSEEAVKEQRLAQEIVLLSDRWDVSEETERLRSHLLKFRD